MGNIFGRLALLAVASLFCLSMHGCGGGNAQSVTNLPAYPVSVNVEPHGSATPSGTLSLPKGSSLTVTFTADPGYVIDTVTVDTVNVGAGPSFTLSNVDSAHTIGATFKLLQSYTITLSAAGGGAISPSGTIALAQGTSQTFAFIPNAGYSVASVTVDGINVGAVSSYTLSDVQGAHFIAAKFAADDSPVWSDEFDAAEIDTSKWAFDLGNGPTNPGPLYGWGNGEMQYYTSSKDNAAIEAGSLVITARRQDWGTKPFTSARLVTRGKFSFKQGRFVARIKMPEGNRMWPAFWLLGDTVEDWPKSGEIDIAEMFAGTVGRGDNASFATAHWWDEKISQHMMNGATWNNLAKLSSGFHEYELVWDDKSMRGKVDGVEYWTLDITAATMSELRENSYYIVLNLAVGSPNFGMTSPTQADGPLPQKMAIDYVRVYATTGSSVTDEVASQPRGNLGILADGTTTASHIDLARDATLLLWNNLAPVEGVPAAGLTSLAVQTGGTAWFGFGYAATKRRNLTNYAAGYLNFSAKTTSTDAFKVGINGGNDGDAWVSVGTTSGPYSLVRDGKWHKISIPMTRFGGADFSDIRQYFMVASDDANGLHVGAGQTYEFDEIFWSENAPENMSRPAGTQFGIYTDRACDAGNFNASSDGGIFIWNKANGALTGATPSEGANAAAFNSPGAQWFGLGFTPEKLYDLTAFKTGHLHIALQVPAKSTSDFKIGIKSPGGPAVRESWIKFKSGADPYGMLRDGNYHQLIIPATDFSNSDFSAISVLLMIAGDGPATITFDDVYWTAN